MPVSGCVCLIDMCTRPLLQVNVNIVSGKVNTRKAALDIVYCIVYIITNILYSIHRTLYSVHWAIYNVNCTVYIIQIII